MKRMDLAISSVMKKPPKMIRFYALRMILEISLGKRLSPDQQHELFRKCRAGVLEAEI